MLPAPPPCEAPHTPPPRPSDTSLPLPMLGDAQSGATFEFLDGVGRSGFHGYSHHGEKAEKKDSYRRICLWHVEQAAYLLAKMKSLDEDGSSLLDNSMVLFGSSIKDGNRHTERDLPLILAGKGQGALRPGRPHNSTTVGTRPPWKRCGHALGKASSPTICPATSVRSTVAWETSPR